MLATIAIYADEGAVLSDDVMAGMTDGRWTADVVVYL